MKGQCTSAVEMLMTELSQRFSNSNLINALSIVFPQFWLQSNANDLFPLHLKTLKSHFCHFVRLGCKQGNEK